MRSWDVSMPLFEGTPTFPGDPTFQHRPVRSIERGDAYSVSALSFGSHAGTHVDPPCHFIAGGATVDRLDLEVLNGPCWVAGVPPDVRSVGPEEVGRLPEGTRRVLFRTSNSPRWQEKLEFFSDYVAVSESGARALVDRKVRLVGVDALSVESDASGRFPVHHRLLGEGVLIIEGLLLADVPEGPYELHCLPLDLKGGDGGPARAVLTAP